MNRHSKTCRYKESDCMKYAFMQLKKDFYAIIDAEEVSFFDELLELGKNEETDIPVDDTSIDGVPYKLVYGGILFNQKLIDMKKAMEIVNSMVGYSYIHIEQDKATVCQYAGIKVYPEWSTSDNFIPFAALMKLPYSLADRECSITLTPVINEKGKEYCIWEYMVNRPFLLACRDEDIVDDLSEDNFDKHINTKKLMNAYNLADIVLTTEEET